MSPFSLTRGSEAALGMLASQAGSETLLLTQPARELRAELSIEPFTSDSGDQLLAVLLMREQRHSMTLQRDDGANVQHLADWIEAVANGTVDTAEAIPQRADPSDLAAATAAFHAAAHELNAQAEPAPAQDERECCCPKIGEPWNPEKHGRDCPAHQAKRPAQTEQQPVATIQLPDPLDERDGISLSHADLRRLAALPAGTKLYVGNGPQTALLDALTKYRIALTPEYEGRWHADLYGSFEKPVFSAEGDTPEEAVDAVIRGALSATSPTA